MVARACRHALRSCHNRRVHLIKRARTFELTPHLVASYGGAVVCLSIGAIGARFPLFSLRPGREINLRAHREKGGGIEWRSDLPSGANHKIEPVPAAPALIRVDISGALLQRAGYQGECGGWADGHDAVCERLCAAFETADVLLVVDSPGGAAAGIQQSVTRALASKVANGRRVTVWADEQIGSAATWWAMALGDDIFIPAMGTIGSIGARSGHMSIAGALAKDGIVPTFFADPPDKVVFAQELPLSDEGMRRGNRDVKACGDAFRAALCASSIGMRNGFTPEFLFELGADMLTGQVAVDKGLADGVATFEEVTAYALAQAGREEAAVRR